MGARGGWRKQSLKHRDKEAAKTAAAREHEHVVIRGEDEELARHARGTHERLLIDPAHYEGPSTDRVKRPTPLGRRGRLQVAELSSGAAASFLLLPAGERIARPLDEYVRLVEALQ